MARPTRSRRLNVFLNAKCVGHLERTASGAISFSYDKDWLDWQGSMPVSISLPLRGEIYRGESVTNVFENLLPDAEHVRRNVAERLGADGTDAFSLLTVAGRDCVGALQFLPPDGDPGKAGAVNGTPLTDTEIANLIRRLRIAPLGLEAEDEDFRISIAGAQDKTALLRKDGAWLKPTGTTATTHILKPAIGVIHDGIDLGLSVQNEYVCLKLCEALGLSVAVADIETFEDQIALSVRRFDRQWTEDGRLLRLPQEDFCQAMSVPSTLKYQRDGGPSMLDILERLKESDTPNEDRAAFFRGQIVFWLVGASDGHAKNYSIQHRPGGGLHLAPLYDVLSAQPIVDSRQLTHNRFKLAMSAGTKNHNRMDEITRRHFAETAEAANLPKGTLNDICSDLEARLASALETIAGLVGNTIPAALVVSIANGVSLDRQKSELIPTDPPPPNAGLCHGDKVKIAAGFYYQGRTTRAKHFRLAIKTAADETMEMVPDIYFS